MKLGIDLGGTSIKGGLFDDGMTLVKEASVPTHGQEGRKEIFAALFSLIEKLLTQGVTQIGISSAGNIDPARGVCVYATDNLMGWTGADVKGEVETKFHIPCRVDNDAVCALKGELSFYPSVRNATMLTFGTGVGGASLVNGEIVRGSRFDGARWGHVTLFPNGRACNCGKRGCAESYLSATALLRRGREKLPALEDCKQLFALAKEGDKEAQKTLEEFGGALNLLLNNIRTALAPELIILGGGVAQSEEQIYKLIEDKSDIAFARLKNRAGMVGALL